VWLDLHNQKRQRLFRVYIDPQKPPAVVKSPDGRGAEVKLDWHQRFDDQGHLLVCPVCGCHELFVRKDFSQIIGLCLVFATITATAVLFAMRRVWTGFAVLAAMAALDAIICLFTHRCIVCYRCRSEAGHLPIPSDQRGWDLAIGEKYRSPTNVQD